MTDEIRGRARTFLGRLPLFAVIIYCGVARPDAWLTVSGAIGLAIAVALVLMAVVPRLAERIGASSQTPS